MAFLSRSENRIRFTPLLLVLPIVHVELASSVWGASPSGTVSRFLRHLYPEKPGNVTLGKNGVSTLYLICGRAGTENHTYKHVVDTNLARSTRKRL